VIDTTRRLGIDQTVPEEHAENQLLVQVAVDGSAGSGRALEWALQEAALRLCAVELVTAYNLNTASPQMTPGNKPSGPCTPPWTSSCPAAMLRCPGRSSKAIHRRAGAQLGGQRNARDGKSQRRGSEAQRPGFGR
jgi:hypothetical protein